MCGNLDWIDRRTYHHSNFIFHFCLYVSSQTSVEFNVRMLFNAVILGFGNFLLYLSFLLLGPDFILLIFMLTFFFATFDIILKLDSSAYTPNWVWGVCYHDIDFLIVMIQHFFHVVSFIRHFASGKEWTELMDPSLSSY